MKLQILFSVLIALLLVQIPNSFSELEVFTNSKVYAPIHNLQIYGQGLPEENLILRLFAPDDTIAKFDQITTELDGSFNYGLLIWPEPSTSFPYGTYTATAFVWESIDNPTALSPPVSTTVNVS